MLHNSNNTVNRWMQGTDIIIAFSPDPQYREVWLHFWSYDLHLPPQLKIKQNINTSI